MRFIGYVTMRLLSQRLPHKSVMPLGGKPLIQYPLELFESIPAVEKVLLVSKEDPMKWVGQHHYTWVGRSDKSISDDATFNDVLAEVINTQGLPIDEHTYLIYLSCTSPFIKVETVDEMIAHIMTGKYDSAFAAISRQAFCWHGGKPLYPTHPIPKTQDLEPVLEETSGLYIFNTKFFAETGRRIGDKPYIKIVSRLEGHDIDTPEDFKIAEALVGM